ncbi:hypothetical protein [Alkaliphilus transvaalensis]|uniref:hypothetical protein n=1 Tax=Alkaliphilus transvaalensis TaxID=114628 RepID=UPI00047E95E0|nr:hypothetical protein [Alkaliphilus transvaalensis]
MASLIRQTVSEPKKPFWQNMMYILAIVLIINVLVELTNFLPRGMAGIVSILILVLAGIFCSYLINRKLAQYTYVLIDDELIFHKQLGKREHKVLNVKVYDLDWVRPIDEVTDKGEAKKIYSLSCKLKGEEIYVGQFERENKIYRFIFQPNETLYKAIDKQLKVKS